jgi:hypothetical protein
MLQGISQDVAREPSRRDHLFDLVVIDDEWLSCETANNLVAAKNIARNFRDNSRFSRNRLLPRMEVGPKFGTQQNESRFLSIRRNQPQQQYRHHNVAQVIRPDVSRQPRRFHPRKGHASGDAECDDKIELGIAAYAFAGPLQQAGRETDGYEE